MQAAATVMPLEYPRSVAVYATYAEAQRAVDHLADKEFPVQHLCIVGTDLKQVERIVGRRTWGTVLAGGFMSGLTTGIFFGLILGLLPGTGFTFTSAMAAGVTMGVLFGMMSAALAQVATRGARDFSSVQAIVATRYEVLGEHKVVNEARRLLGQEPLAQPVSAPWPPVPTQNPGQGE